jgi:hypothetical protein
MLKIGVQLPVGPLFGSQVTIGLSHPLARRAGGTRGGFDSRDFRCRYRKVAGYGWPGSSRKRCPLTGMTGSNPSPSALCLAGETGDHTDLLNRRSGFDSRAGRCLSLRCRRSSRHAENVEGRVRLPGAALAHRLNGWSTCNCKSRVRLPPPPRGGVAQRIERQSPRKRALWPPPRRSPLLRSHNGIRPRGVVALAHDPAKVEAQVRFLTRTLAHRLPDRSTWSTQVRILSPPRAAGL